MLKTLWDKIIEVCIYYKHTAQTEKAAAVQTYFSLIIIDLSIIFDHQKLETFCLNI